MQIKDILKQVDFFSELSDDQLSEVTLAFNEKIYPEDEIIFEENSFGDKFYIIKEGKVEITRKLSFDGKTYETELSFFEPYNYFGEMALFDNSPRSATVKSITQVTLLEIEKEDFLEACIKFPTIVLKMIKTLSNRMRLTNDKYMSIWDSLLKKNRMAAIGNAASKIVHDIKTPITVIVLTAQLISKLFPDTDKFSQKIVRQTEIMGEMIHEILDFARGQQSILDRKPIKISEVFTEVQEELTIIADSKNIVLSFDNSSESTLMIDFQKIKRTLTNIIKNAIEAIQEKGEINVCSFDDENHLNIIINDNGPGIPEHILTSIFDPFVTSGKKTGTGLGLAICQKVVNDHGGDIQVRNISGGGASFSVKLPLER